SHSRRPCKHMYLLDRLFKVFQINYFLNPEPADNIEDDNGQDNMDEERLSPIPEHFPPPVMQLLTIECSR
ncbi:hypothetical protein BGZ94_004944, partial [Podila epigama]